MAKCTANAVLSVVKPQMRKLWTATMPSTSKNVSWTTVKLTSRGMPATIESVHYYRYFLLFRGVQEKRCLKNHPKNVSFHKITSKSKVRKWDFFGVHKKHCAEKVFVTRLLKLHISLENSCHCRVCYHFFWCITFLLFFPCCARPVFLMCSKLFLVIYCDHASCRAYV